MTVRDTGPTDDEFTKLMDERAPNRQKDPDTWEPEEVTPPVVDAPVPVLEEDGLVPEPVVDTPVAPPLDPKYAGKTTDELIEMHRNAESRIGTQGQELGELRSLRSEFDRLRGEIDARADTPQPLTQETVDWVEESVVGNPLGTLKWVEENQPALKERALATWGAIDPLAASAYTTQKLIEENDKKWEARLASVETPFRAHQTDTQLAAAYQAVSTSLPGFNDVAGELPTLLEANPELKSALVSGDLASKQRILENLGKQALFDKAMAQPAPVAEVPPVAIDPRVAASVTSGSSTGEHGGETATEASKLKASMLAPGPTNLHEELARNRATVR